MVTLGASGGLGGINRRADVIAVQRLLQQANVSPGPIDGLCGRRTIAAIERFQHGLIAHPDGRAGGTGHPAAPAIGYAFQRLLDRTHLVAEPRRQSRPDQRAADRPARRSHRDAGHVEPATESVGPFRVTGLKPAMASLRAVLGQVHSELPDLYGLLGSLGMRMVRKTRGRSTYSWGIALDLQIALQTPPLGTTCSLRGLDALSPYFNRAGWYWGGGYRNVTRKDPMHFECGLALVRRFGL